MQGRSPGVPARDAGPESSSVSRRAAGGEVKHAGCGLERGLKSHQDAVIRLAEVPGLGVDSAQQIIAEVGAQASTFPSAAELTSWVGTCPGKEESAEQNHSSRSAREINICGGCSTRAAHAAVTKKGSYFQVVFRRLLPRLGYKSAILGHRPSSLPSDLEDLA